MIELSLLFKFLAVLSKFEFWFNAAETVNKSDRTYIFLRKKNDNIFQLLLIQVKEQKL